MGGMEANPFESPKIASKVELMPSGWHRKPPWVVAGLVTLLATYGPLGVMMATVHLPSGFIDPRALMLPCWTLTPFVLVVGTYIGRKSVLALAIISGLLLAATTFTALVTYSLLDA